jgi:hypothetical protein
MMDGNNRTLLITAVLGLTLLMAGCTSAITGDSGGSDALPDDMTADDLQQRAVNASEEVESTTFTMDMSMDLGDQGSAEMSADGAMDMAAEKMRMEMEMDAPGQSFEISQYIIGETIYQNLDGVWQQQSAPGFWDQSQYAQQQEALESATEFEVVGQSTVNDHDVYEMEIDIDEEQLLETVQQQGTQQGMGSLYENADISNVEMTQYIDTETYQIRQVEMSMDMSMMGQDATMDMTMTYDDINEPVDITLPEEAEGASGTGTDY